MADSLSDDLKNAIGAAVFRGVDLTADPALWLALSSTDPLSDGTGITEPAIGGYARQPITFGAPASPGVFTNDTDVFFPPATVDYAATIAWVALYNDATAGSFRGRALLTSSQTVTAGDQVRLLTGAGVATIG